MLVISIIKTILLLVLGVWTSVTDIRRGIIENKYLLPAALVGMVLTAVEWIGFSAAPLPHQLMNMAIISVVAVVLYAQHIWAGGDCKLMLTLIWLIPHGWYIPLFGKWLVALVLFALMFLLSYLYVMIDSVVQAIRLRRRISKGAFARNLAKAVGRWISVAGYIWLLDQLLLVFCSEGLARFPMIIWVVNIGIILLVTSLPVLRNRWVVTGVLVAGVAVKAALRAAFFDEGLLIHFAVVFILVAFRLWMNEYTYETINTEEVKPGMILSAATTMLFAGSRMKGLPAISKEDLKSRLSEEEAKRVRKWARSASGVPTIQIVRKIPFAVFMAASTGLIGVLGVLFT